MPLTPFHFGPSVAVALPLKKYVDIPVFILANVIIDTEPLTVMLLKLPYPLHGFFHTLIGGIFIGALWGLAAYKMRNIIGKIMYIIHLSYHPNRGSMVLSGILGFWFHVFLDSFMHADIRPLYPLSFNPLYQLISTPHLYLICTLLFIPALFLYINEAWLNKSKFP